MSAFKHISCVLLLLFLAACSKTPPQICSSIDAGQLKSEIEKNLSNDLKAFDYLCEKGTDCASTEKQLIAFSKVWEGIKSRSTLTFRVVDSSGSPEQAICSLQFLYKYPTPKDGFYEDKEYKYRDLKVNVWAKTFSQDISIDKKSWYKLNAPKLIDNFYCESNPLNLELNAAPFSYTIQQYVYIHSMMLKETLGITASETQPKIVENFCDKAMDHFRSYGN